MNRGPLLFLFASFFVLSASADVLTFDTLPGPQALIPNGYGGLNWNNFYYLNADTYAAKTSGYQNGVVSHSNVAFNGSGRTAIASGGVFTFNSAYFTAAWNDGLSITVSGYNSGNLVETRTFVVDSSGPTLEIFNWSGIDALGFASSGGVNRGYIGAGTHFAVENMVINARLSNARLSEVPEPSAIALLATAIAGTAIALRRRYRRG